MVGMHGMNPVSAYAKAGKAEDKNVDQAANKYGKTVGEPELSDKAAKYYDQLKSKYGQYDFILVSKDEIANAKANSAKYANGFKTVVLIDEEKIERMANDEAYRKKYENILSGVDAQLNQMKEQMAAMGANVKGYGIQVGEDGKLSFFAVLKKSSADQKARIERGIEKKHEAKKAAEKKAAKKEKEERVEKSREKNKSQVDDSDEIISANSIEELMAMLSDRAMALRSDSVMTEAEKAVGGHIDFKG